MSNLLYWWRDSIRSWNDYCWMLNVFYIFGIIALSAMFGGIYWHLSHYFWLIYLLLGLCFGILMLLTLTFIDAWGTSRNDND